MATDDTSSEDHHIMSAVVSCSVIAVTGDVDSDSDRKGHRRDGVVIVADTLSGPMETRRWSSDGAVGWQLRQWQVMMAMHTHILMRPTTTLTTETVVHRRIAIGNDHSASAAALCFVIAVTGDIGSDSAG